MHRITLKPGVLFEYLEAQGIDRDQLAARIGVDRTTAYRVHNGKVDPSPKFIAGLMAETGRPFEELFQIKSRVAA